MWKRQVASLLAAAALTGCATAPDFQNKEPKDKVIEAPANEAEGFGCLANTVQYALGEKATAELGSKLMRESGAEMLRWIPPRTAVTMDYRAERLNVSYDDDMRITRIGCG